MLESVVARGGEKTISRVRWTATSPPRPNSQMVTAHWSRSVTFLVGVLFGIVALPFESRKMFRLVFIFQVDSHPQLQLGEFHGFRSNQPLASSIDFIIAGIERTNRVEHHQSLAHSIAESEWLCDYWSRHRVLQFGCTQQRPTGNSKPTKAKDFDHCACEPQLRKHHEDHIHPQSQQLLKKCAQMVPPTP